MTRNEGMPLAFRNAIMRLRTAPVRLFGLNVGDWSTLFLGLVLSSLLLALS